MPTTVELRRETATTKARYDRIAPFYDAMEWFTERSAFQNWRQDLWSRVPACAWHADRGHLPAARRRRHGADRPAGRILEVGVGTGKNMPYYPEGARVTAIDLSDRMLEQARRRAQSLGLDVDLRQMDAQELTFPDDTFEAVVATFVFCSVPDPLQGLRELGRVTKSDGDIWLLEHVRINKPVIGPLMDALNPVVVRMTGANINRQTVENARRAGLQVLGVEHLSGELVKLIHARPAPRATVDNHPPINRQSNQPTNQPTNQLAN